MPARCAACANALAASVDPPPSVVELAGGNPFFLEEILAMSGESGGDDRVPETVQGVIAARLDLLDPERQAAASAGRRWSGGASRSSSSSRS